MNEELIKKDAVISFREGLPGVVHMRITWGIFSRESCVIGDEIKLSDIYDAIEIFIACVAKYKYTSEES